MAPDLKSRPGGNVDDDRNPGQAAYDKKFADLTSAERRARDGEGPESEELRPEEKGFYNPDGENSEGGGESTSTESSSSSTGGLYNETRDSKQSLRQRAVNRFKGNRLGKISKAKFLIGGAIGGSALIGLVLVLLLFMSALKIPHLMENITQYQLARVFQRYAAQQERTTNTKIAIDSANDSNYNKFKQRYATVSGRTAEQWSKLDKYRPEKTVKNLRASGMTFNYEPRGPLGLGGRKLTSITLPGDGNGTLGPNRGILVPQTTLRQGLIPGYRFVNNAELAARFSPELDKALRAREVGPIVRGQISKNLRKQLGIGLVAWKVGEYKGKTREQARLIAERESVKRTLTKPGAVAVTDAVKEGVAETEKASAQTLADDAKLTAAIANGGVSTDVIAAADRAVSVGAFAQTAGYINDFYAIATPICIVYDGSVQRSGPTVDSNSNAQIKGYHFLSTAADQQKNGYQGSAEATGAINDKLGNITNSNALKRSGNQAYTTGGRLSAQAAPAGGFSIFNAIFDNIGLSGAADGANAVADDVCPVLTSPEFAVAGAVASIITLFGSGGTSKVAGTAAAKTTTTILERVVAKFTKESISNVSSKLGAVLKDTGKSAGKIAATTILAKLIVMNQAGEFNNGLEQGADYANMADSGGNLYGNEVSRRQQYGRPLNNSETKVAAAETYAYVSKQNTEKPVFERYLALNNPNSLLSTLGTRMASTSLGSIARSIAQPVRVAASTISSINPTAGAATLSSLNYDNIQWGWTEAEMKKLDEPSYQSLENDKILDESGKRFEIFQKYGPCFSEETTQGTLIQDGLIVRDDQGNVTDEGDCSPRNLGMKNPQYGELVFRWRVSQADSIDLDNTINFQEVSDDTTAGTGEGEVNFTLASLNVFHSDDQAKDVWEARLKRSVQVLADNNVGIAGLQEVRPNQQQAFIKPDFGGNAYSMYPVAASNSDPKFSPNPIVWKTAEYDAAPVESGVPFTYFDGMRDKAPLIKFTHKATGRQFYVANTHDPADTAKQGQHEQERYANAKAYAEFFANLAKEGLPIFFTGDFNNRYAIRPNDNQNEPLNNLRENLTYCILTKQSSVFDDAADAAKEGPTSPGETCGSGGATAANRNSVDHIFMTRDVEVTRFENLGDKGVQKNGSDAHDTLLADISILDEDGGTMPAVAVGTDGWTWPLSQNDWNGPFGYNVWGSCGVKCRHAGIDLSGTGGDQVVAMHSGLVTSVRDAGVCKDELIIKADGSPYYYAYQHMGSITVKSGEKVAAGQPVGTVDPVGPVGSCGSGAHLHVSIERKNSVSAYADGARLQCDINTAACAKNMTSLPPLCFLDKGSRNYGSSVLPSVIKGTPYCNEVTGVSVST